MRGVCATPLDLGLTQDAVGEGTELPLAGGGEHIRQHKHITSNSGFVGVGPSLAVGVWLCYPRVYCGGGDCAGGGVLLGLCVCPLCPDPAACEIFSSRHSKHMSSCVVEVASCVC